MHTLPVLQKFFRHALPAVHARRRQALTEAVDAVAQGSRVAITALGRSLPGPIRIKHRVKRMDRLVGNRLLYAQRDWFYRVIIERMLAGSARPLILIDWSDFSADRQQQLLRASVPVGGRAVTLYEELHPYEQLANRAVQHRFLDRLAALVPAHCLPIVIADAGFRVPFFRYVEHLGWHWLGRIRNRDYVQWDGAPHEWVGAKSLYAIATPRAQDLGLAYWVRYRPLEGRLVLIRQARQGRKDRSLQGPVRRSRLSRQHAERAREPWLLIASPSLQDDSARQIVRMYRTRMQIEENFRDTKSVAYGLGIANERHTSFERATNLLLIAALATFALWVIGCLAKTHRWDRMVRVNSTGRTTSYSALFLARLIIAYSPARLPRDCLNEAGRLVADYLRSVSEA